MNPKPPKPKFVPPIRTAASYLSSMPRSPEGIQIKKEVGLKELTPEVQKRKRLLKKTGALSDRIPGCFSPKPFQGTLHSLSPPPMLNNDRGIYILPSSPNHLRALVKASRKGKHICSKEKCLEQLLLNDTQGAREESYKQHFDFRSISPTNDLNNLYQWFQFMKEKNFSTLEEDEKSYKTLGIEKLEETLSVLDLVLKSGLQELIRQVSLQSNERGEILKEMLKFYKIYVKAKAFHAEEHSKDVIKTLQKTVIQANEALEKVKKENKDREDAVTVI